MEERRTSRAMKGRTRKCSQEREERAWPGTWSHRSDRENWGGGSWVPGWGQRGGNSCPEPARALKDELSMFNTGALGLRRPAIPSDVASTSASGRGRVGPLPTASKHSPSTRRRAPQTHPLLFYFQHVDFKHLPTLSVQEATHLTTGKN